MHASPLVGSDGVVYIGSTSGVEYALRPGANPSTRVLWSTNVLSPIEGTAAIGADGTLYVPTTGRKLLAFGP